MKLPAILLMAVLVLAGCNTVDAMKNNASREGVVVGVKKDAKATGDAVERGAHEVGSALGKAFKHGGEKLEDASK